MSLYIPRHFTGDAAAGRALIAAHPFATLVTAQGGDTHITHLPLLLDAAAGELVGHVARANPHWQALDRGASSAVFHGPHAFISRHWYREPAENVPTWNYAAVHVHGTARLLDETASRAALLRLEARFEPPGAPPVREERLAALLGGIVAFALRIAAMDVKLKLSQNKPPAERAGLLAGLRTVGGADALAVADWMEAHGA